MKEKYFGDKDKFAICYLPGYKTKEHNYYFATLHFVFSGQIIGNPNEMCHLLSWLASVECLLKRIWVKSELLKIDEFKNRSDEEVFELIWKANQLEDEFDPKFKHLPVLDNSIWAACQIAIDETTDAWLITMVQDDDELKFIWKGWRDPCPEDRIGKLYFVSIDREFVIKTIEECIIQIEEDYKHYPEKVWIRLLTSTSPNRAENQCDHLLLQAAKLTIEK